MSMEVPFREGLFFGGGGGGGERRGDVEGVGGLVETHGVGETGGEEIVVHDGGLGNDVGEVVFFFFCHGGEGGEVTTGEEEGFEGPTSPEGDDDNERII